MNRCRMQPDLAQRALAAWSAIRRCRSRVPRKPNLPAPRHPKSPRSLVLPDRIDRHTHVLRAGARCEQQTPQRWEAAMIALGVASASTRHSNRAARTLCESVTARRHTKYPKSRPFFELMQLANWPRIKQLVAGELFASRNARRRLTAVLQAARVRAAYQRAYFRAGVVHLIRSGRTWSRHGVDTRWRLYYNETSSRRTAGGKCAVLIHEVSICCASTTRASTPPRPTRAFVEHGRGLRINDDLLAEGLPLRQSADAERFGQQRENAKPTIANC